VVGPAAPPPEQADTPPRPVQRRPQPPAENAR
jgi:hypothetical protein